MIDGNVLTILLILALFLLWKLEFVATILNLKAFPSQAPEELSSLLNEQALSKARDYLRVNARFDILKSIISLTILLTFWSLDGFEWLQTFSMQVAGPFQEYDIVIGLIYISAIFIALSLVQLPFSYYATFIIEERFGFNRSTHSTFIADRFKGLMLSAVLGLPLVAALLGIFHEVERAWLWAWLVVTMLQLILAWLAPTYILPLFNKFTPMEAGDLKDEIETLGKKCGFPLDEVYVMDGSKRTSKANAFFTGFGKYKKIALFDTLIDGSSRKELISVLAHEIGHFRRGHIKKRLIGGIIQTAVIFFLLGAAIDPNGSIAPYLFEAFGVTDISPHVGLVIFMILLEPVTRLLGIVLNAWSRKHEYEADAYAVEVTGEAESLSNALRKMTADQLAHPTPSRLRVMLDYSHPPLIDRLRAMRAIETSSSE